MRVGSEILDNRVLSLGLKTDDEQLQRLLGDALEAFYDRSGGRKTDGVKHLVDAYGMIKSSKHSEPKRSAEEIVNGLSPHEEVRAHFDAHLRKMWEFANKYAIRHHRPGAVPIEDEALIDYLFYSYYNLVRLILEKHGLAE